MRECAGKRAWRRAWGAELSAHYRMDTWGRTWEGPRGAVLRTCARGAARVVAHAGGCACVFCISAPGAERVGGARGRVLGISARGAARMSGARAAPGSLGFVSRSP